MGALTELRVGEPRRAPLGPDDVVLLGENLASAPGLTAELGKLARALGDAGWEVNFAVEAGGKAMSSLTLSVRR